MQKLKRQRAADMPRRGRTPAKRARPLGGDRQRRIHTGGVVVPARSPPTMGAMPCHSVSCTQPVRQPENAVVLLDRVIISLQLLTGLRTAHGRASGSLPSGLQHEASADLDDWLAEEEGATFAPVSRRNGRRPDASLGQVDAEEVRLSISPSEQPLFPQHIMPRIWA